MTTRSGKPSRRGGGGQSAVWGIAAGPRPRGGPSYTPRNVFPGALRRDGGRRVAGAIGLGLGVTALRFALEKVAAPTSWTQAVGITWLAPVVGAVFLARLREEGRGLKALLGALAVYAVAARGTVALLMVAASAL